ncbi:MAG TPA: DNA polymerase III subunit delta' [Burkholderiales bacterium]
MADGPEQGAVAGRRSASLPWHAATWAALTRDTSRLPHALLLHGPEGLGKRALAWRLAKTLLCAQPGADAAACGACASCALLQAGTHPDLLHIRPLAESSVITIDQVRELREFAALKPHSASRKVALLEPAEAMNLNAANALLKVLEEPPGSTVLILVTPRLARLPATIRSRCAQVALRTPAPAEAAAWLRGHGIEDTEAPLAAAGGAPLRALELAQSGDMQKRAQVLQDIARLADGVEDPLRCAARWKDYGTEQCLEWLQRCVSDWIRKVMSGDREAQRKTKNPRLVKGLFEFVDAVSEARMLASGPLDQTLLLEDLLIRWARLFRAHGLN